MVPWFYAGCSFTVVAFCIQELCCLDFMILVLLTTFGIPHFGIMLPRFHVPCFIYGIWILHPLFWNYVASILCSFFFLRYVHSAFWNYVASIPCSFFHLRYLKFCIPHSGIMLPRFYVPFFSRYVHSGIMSPRLHNHWLFTHRIFTTR